MRGRAWWLALALSLAAGEAGADLKLKAQPLLGADALHNDGWSTLLVRVESTEKAPVQGTVSVRSTGPKSETTTEAPVSLLPGATVSVRLPLMLAQSWSIQASLRDGAGKELAGETLYARGRREPLVVDLHATPRMAPLLKGAVLSVSHEAHKGGRGSGGGLSLSFGAALFDPASGDPILPRSAAEWGAATVVLAPSDMLARLGDDEREALANHVLSGGTLAVVIKRPEDLRQGLLPRLLGAPAQEAGAARALQRLSSPRPPGATRGDKGDKGDKGAAGGMVVPSREVAEALVSYSGGNLVPSDFGSSAPYGLGEVHLLAFDAGKAPEVDDLWVQSRVLELARHAWDRRAFLVMPPGGGLDEDGSSKLGALRKPLDPNESHRWSIAVVALLLTLYGVLAGPINFLLSARAGRPLRALVILPLLSALFFGVVVAVAVATKGLRGEARRLSLAEASGGMTRGSLRRYRSFFSPKAQQARVEASSAQGLPCLVGDEESKPSLWVDRGGAELRGVNVLSWQSVVVREDDMADLGGGVALVPSGGGVRVINRTGRDLRGVVVQAPGQGLFFHATLRDGASVEAASGRALRAPVKSSTSGPGPDVYFLSLDGFGDQLEPQSAGLSAAWSTFDELSRDRRVDWWPEGQPVLLAQIDGGEGLSRDQGLRLSKDRALLRVVGFGGAP